MLALLSKLAVRIVETFKRWNSLIQALTAEVRRRSGPSNGLKAALELRKDKRVSQLSDPNGKGEGALDESQRSAASGCHCASSKHAIAASSGVETALHL